MRSYLISCVIIFTVCIGYNCNQVNLSTEEAKALISKSLLLPIQFTQEVDGVKKDGYDPTFSSQKLEKMGLISIERFYNEDPIIHLADKGRPYFIGERPKEGYIGNKYKILTFKSFDVALNEINGIALNKEDQTATIRFSLKAINISPIGRALEYDIDKPKNGELIYKKFDRGWQLASNQNKSSVDLVREIWWGKDN